jgi:integrase
MFRMGWSWVDQDNALLAVLKPKRRGEGYRKQIIPLAPPALAAFKALDSAPHCSAWVFPGRSLTTGESQELSNKRKSLQTGLKEGEISPEGVSSHSFRRSFATHLERTPGVTYSLVRTLLRHGKRSADITARYSLPLLEDQRAALKNLTALVLGADYEIWIEKWIAAALRQRGDETR